MEQEGPDSTRARDVKKPSSSHPPIGPKLWGHTINVPDEPTLAEPLVAPERSAIEPPQGPKLLEQSSNIADEPTLGEAANDASSQRASIPPQRLSVPPSVIRTTRTSAIPSASWVGSVSRQSTSPTVTRAMHDEEATRARTFARGLGALCCIGLAFQPVLSPPIWLRGVLSIAIFAMLCVCIWVYRRARDEERYSPRVFRTFATSCVIVSPVVVYYCGVFSPAPLIVTLGIAFFGLGDDERFAVGAPLVAMLLYVLLALLVIVDVFPEAGLFPSVGAQTFSKIFMLILVSSVLTVTLWQARSSRAATLEAFRKSNESSRLAALREAQLHEAHLNLERALRAGAGLAGRYSGHQAGAYVLAEVIGRGAMGEVYAATHVETQERAAIKLLSAAGTESPGLLERFMREGEMAMRLDSPYVVRVLDVGATREGAPFIAMELLVGNDLAHELRQKKQLELTKTTELVQQVAQGLSAAHAAAIIHRDLKPQNLFSTATESGERRWKILDFGVSKIAGSSGTLTQHAVVGTPGYMSPEQAQGVVADMRSDLFSLGAVTYRALTGRPPFSGTDTPAILFDIVYKAPVRPSELIPSLPKDIDHVLAIGLAKRREDRFANAEEFAAAFALASEDKLTDDLRERGRTLAQKHPWGRTISQREKKSKKRDKPS